MKIKRILSLILCVAVMACVFQGCSDKKDADAEGVVSGEITLELYRDKAPITVQNFVDLANAKFYDGLTFHRIYEGFMIQGGDPEGTGAGGSDKKIKGEFSANGVDNDLSHTRGVISMARQGENPYTGEKNYDSASCQFFIVHQDSTFLDGQYASFGKVIEGMDVVDALAAVETTYNAGGEKSTPLVKQYMKTIRVIEDNEKTVKVKIVVGK